ncbi:MAG: hypothetical protein GWO41_12360 [candidate division Zixibacteria bacterium]|nr:hypothetical protein [candidate division Zixibacteria bacterium]NIR66060.1 hypothetical protein [candidate division Zixibacteria bacterium]NIS17144.1 hypothetical protein [candidate division Zixibacteria bacterium]NIS47690.1 hypothetical protein [candidate division Zixibacteria bacterium]NIT53499.1 hypothetical protein [candidate division Zixibacteria bacterium]
MKRRRIPTKAELLKLQKTYRTDKKIGEALGGVPEYLVAYWRRKKGVPKHSFPKYSESQIRELWERYGDDFHCGRELGISKAAFYRWRDIYGIKEKPQALKLEQLELSFGWETKLGPNGSYVEYYQTAYQKILARACGKQMVQPGDIIRITPDLIILPVSLASANLDPKIEQKCWWYKGNGFCKSDLPSGKSARLLNGVLDILSKGQVKPNQLIATTFPEVNALGAYSAAVVNLDEKLASAALEGQVELVVPPAIKVTISGRMQKDFSVVDLLGRFFKNFPPDSFKGMMIEFSGAGTEKLSGEEKMALCYMARLAGAEGVFCLFDESTRKSLAQRTKVQDKIYFSDRKAHYESQFHLNSVGLVNYVFPEGKIFISREAGNLSSIRPDTVFIGGPCGGTAGLLKSIADQARGRRLQKNVSCYISALTQEDLSEGIKKKSIQTLVDYGCQLLPVGMSLNDFLKIVNVKGTVLSVPDFSPLKNDDLKLIFCSGETAIAAAASGKAD